MCQQRCWRWSRRIVAVTAAQTTALFGAHCRQVHLIFLVLSVGDQSSQQSQSIFFFIFALISPIHKLTLKLHVDNEKVQSILANFF